MTMNKLRRNPTSLCLSLLFFLFFHGCYLQKTCSKCGSLEVPYPLSTHDKCGDPNYSLHCDSHSHKLYFNTLNGSSYLVLRIMPSIQRLVLQPSPWIPGTCVSRDALVSQGLWLNQSLPFNTTSSNTIFLFNCSPRLFVSPLNCSASSLCHRFLESSGHVDVRSASQCAGGLHPCCTFVAGGMPSAYKIRLHDSGCMSFRSIIHLDAGKPADQWEEGLEIQWTPPYEPHCESQSDCSGLSICSSIAKKGVRRCLCRRGYSWDHVLGTCFMINKKNSNNHRMLRVLIGVAVLLVLAVVLTVFMVRCRRRFSNQVKLAKAREEALRLNDVGKYAKRYSLGEMKKATNKFSKDRILGSGGFGEVYKGELQDGTVVAIKSAKVGNVKSTEQVLNEVGILSQVNHKNLVRLLGCCVEAEQPLMVYEYVPNGTLHDHLHGKYSNPLNWNTRLRIAAQMAEALAYLHSAAYNPIYHRDVKSTNILLDNEFNAKVSDFGISRLACPGLSHVSTCAQGTLGYLDPEYYRNYQLTDKSDVYSYGVVLLELLTSKKVVDFSRDQDDVNLVICVKERAKKGLIMEVIDQFLMGSMASTHITESLKSFSELALACLMEKKEERPCMNDVVQQLQRIIRLVQEQEEEDSNVQIAVE